MSWNFIGVLILSVSTYITSNLGVQLIFGPISVIFLQQNIIYFWITGWNELNFHRCPYLRSMNLIKFKLRDAVNFWLFKILHWPKTFIIFWITGWNDLKFHRNLFMMNKDQTKLKLRGAVNIQTVRYFTEDK